MEEGYVKASSDNLPLVDFRMVDDFYCEKVSAESSNVKAKRATRAAYGDSAVAYVQLKREAMICTVKAKITPEHKIRSKYYQVAAVIDEVEEKVLSCECFSCAASAEHCKHAIAFLLWLHRRSEEPSVTSTVCYWKSSSLSRIGKDQPSDLTVLVDKPIPPLKRKGNAFMYAVVKHCQEAKGGVFDVTKAPIFEDVSLHQQSLLYTLDDRENKNPEDFMTFVSHHMTDASCKAVEIQTRKQAECPLWYEMRFGRITASKLYEASKCKTTEGALTEAIMGASKFQPTDAISRGHNLEKPVLKTLAKIKNICIKDTGIILDKKYPLFGASPDGITNDHIIEVKCPISEKTVCNYIKDDVISPRYYYQMQLQMLFARRENGIFCVASPRFENTKEIYVKDVTFDNELCIDAMDASIAFWKKAIYPRLFSE